MTEPEDLVGLLRAVWASDGQRSEDLDDACGPTRNCRNMKDVSFDGMAEPGTDLRAAWREKLRREGKLGPSGSSVRDLVMGPSDAN